jgi:hypothetical protein
MKAFSSGREAKEFVISKIVVEAQRENVILEDERKMLYFSETAWTLPDIMSVNEDFDRQHDQDEYDRRLQGSFASRTSALARNRQETMTHGEMPSAASRRRITTFP